MDDEFEEIGSPDFNPHDEDSVNYKNSRCHEFECYGCDDEPAQPCPMMVNVSCRAVARPNDCGSGYRYEIVDFKTYPENGGLSSLGGLFDDDSGQPKVELQKYHRRSMRSSQSGVAQNGLSSSPLRGGNSMETPRFSQPQPVFDGSGILSDRRSGNGARGDSDQSKRSSLDRFKNLNGNSKLTSDYDFEYDADTANEPDYIAAEEPNAGLARRRIAGLLSFSALPPQPGASKNSRETDSALIPKKKSSHFAFSPRSGRIESTTESGEIVVNEINYHGLSSDLGVVQKNSGSGNTGNTFSSSNMSATLTPTLNEHQRKMLKFLENLYHQKQLTDIVIQVGSCCFNVHRAVLSCYSKYFAAQLLPVDSCHKNTIVLGCNMKPKTFNTILEFMYTGDCRLDNDNLAKVFAASEFLEIPDLKKRCEQTIYNNFEKGNSQTDEAPDTEKQWKQVAENFPAIVKTDQFLNLTPECIQKLLCRDDLVVVSEMDVAKAAIRWLNFEREKRKKWVGFLMSCVQFKELSPEELVKLSSHYDSLLDDEGVRDAILEANWYHTCQKRENACVSNKSEFSSSKAC